jgi:hypothetical protein
MKKEMPTDSKACQVSPQIQLVLHDRHVTLHPSAVLPCRSLSGYWAGALAKLLAQLSRPAAAHLPLEVAEAMVCAMDAEGSVPEEARRLLAPLLMGLSICAWPAPPCRMLTWSSLPSSACDVAIHAEQNGYQLASKLHDRPLVQANLLLWLQLGYGRVFHCRRRHAAEIPVTARIAFAPCIGGRLRRCLLIAFQSGAWRGGSWRCGYVGNSAALAPPTRWCALRPAPRASGGAGQRDSCRQSGP